jgi:hypothetical protein
MLLGLRQGGGPVGLALSPKIGHRCAACRRWDRPPTAGFSVMLCPVTDIADIAIVFPRIAGRISLGTGVRDAPARMGDGNDVMAPETNGPLPEGLRLFSPPV